jgi:RHS repeat-associated protein
VVVDLADGGFVNREEFTPYGTTSFGSFARKRFRFAGRERDEESGLSYLSARYYAAGLGRFVSADPAAPRSGLNGYTYANCSPLSLVDPSGLEPEAVATGETDENGNTIYELPEQVIEISGSAPAPTTLEQARSNGLTEYVTRDQYEQQMRRDIAEGGDYSWLRGPPDEWYATEYPEEARAEADEHWNASVDSHYRGYLAKKTGEWQSATHRMDNAANVAEAAVVFEAAGAAAAVAAPVVVATAEAGTPAITGLATKAMNSAAVMFGASFLYGLAMPPGSPDIPFMVGDDAGRAARPLLSRMSSWFTRGGGSALPDHVRDAAMTVLRALNANLSHSAVFRGPNALLPRDIFTSPITSNTVKGLISTVTKLSGPGDFYIEGEAHVAWDVLLEWAGRQ